MRASRKQLTDGELDIMAVLWQRGQCTAAQIRRCLPAALAHTTVLTVLRVLEDKGFVAHTEEEKAHRFRALVPQDRARTNAAQHLMRKLFDNSADVLLLHVVTHQNLRTEDLRRLRELLDERLREESQ